MYQVLFRIPIKTEWFPEGLPIYGFGVMLFVAFVLCSWIAGRRAVREGVRKEFIQDLIVILFLGGLLGARISYLVMQEGVTDFLDLLYRLPRIWDGGIILYGSIVGGFLAYLVYYFLVLRRHGVTTGKVADILAPSLALGIALGRIGCFCNGCCYGQVPAVEAPAIAVSFPLSAQPTLELVQQGVQTAAGFTVAGPDKQPFGSVRIDKVDPASPAYAAGLRDGQEILKVGDRPVRTVGELSAAFFDPNLWPRGQRTLTMTVRGPATEEFAVTCDPGSLGLHPTQVYETISMFLLFLLLQAYYPFKTRDGQVMALLMICYAVHRSLNELLRNDARPVGFEQYGSVILFAAGALLLFWLYVLPAQYRPTWQSPQPPQPQAT